MDLDPEPANLSSQLLLIFVLILINAFFASAEMAIVSLNKNKIHLLAENNDKRAIAVEKLLEEPTKFLSTIQIGITLAGLFSSAAAATGIAEYIGVYLMRTGIAYGQEIALVLITIVLSYITLVLGELVPKRIALQKSEQIALVTVRPITFIAKVATPFILLLSASTNMVTKLIGFASDGIEEKVSKEEIKSLVEVGQEHGVINQTEKEMINSIFEFDDTIAGKVMTPRTEVFMIDINEPVTEYLDTMLNERYSRIPVYDGDSDNIIGILYMKDFFVEARKVGFENVDVKSIIHPAHFVPVRKNIDDLFKELQGYKRHMAILIDEYGGFCGIVTIEDLIEEIMGEIDDEYDLDEPSIRKIDDNTFVARGIVSVDEVNDVLELKLDEDSEDYDTLGGYIINKIGYIPSPGQECIIDDGNVRFEVEKVIEKRIEYVKITMNN